MGYIIWSSLLQFHCVIFFLNSSLRCLWPFRELATHPAFELKWKRSPFLFARLNSLPLVIKCVKLFISYNRALFRSSRWIFAFNLILCKIKLKKTKPIYLYDYRFKITPTTAAFPLSYYLSAQLSTFLSPILSWFPLSLLLPNKIIFLKYKYNN